MTRKEAATELRSIFISDGDLAEALIIAREALEQESKWTPVSESPKEDGEYLVTLKLIKDANLVDKCSYSHDLYSVDKYDFADEKRPGWYEYNNECGYYEVNNVVAWMPLPEAYKEVKDE